MIYDRWVGNTKGEVILEIKHLGKLWGCRLDLHKISRPDEEGQFHSHPAYAVRLISWGGYIEEVYKGAIDDNKNAVKPHLVTWAMGRLGLVSPHFIHRIAGLLDGPSYSFWLRGPIIAPILLLGWGWPADRRGRSINEPEAK